jgi:hypothetical protein
MQPNDPMGCQEKVEPRPLMSSRSDKTPRGRVARIDTSSPPLKCRRFIGKFLVDPLTRRGFAGRVDGQAVARVATQ